MTEESLMAFAYLTPLTAILALFWNVARKLGRIEIEVEAMRRENAQLQSRIDALRDLLSVVLDSRRTTP